VRLSRATILLMYTCTCTGRFLWLSRVPLLVRRSRLLRVACVFVLRWGLSAFREVQVQRCPDREVRLRNMHLSMRVVEMLHEVAGALNR